MFDLYKRKKSLRDELLLVLSEAQALVAAHELEYKSMQLHAEQLSKDGFTATAHQYINPRKKLLNNFERFEKSVRENIGTWRRKALCEAIKSVRGFCVMLSRPPVHEDMCSNPSEEITLRAVIVDQVADAVELYESIILVVQKNLSDEKRRNTEDLRQFIYIIDTQARLVNTKSLWHFAQLETRKHNLELHLFHMTQFKQSISE